MNERILVAPLKALLFAGVALLPAPGAAQSGNDLLFGVFRMGMKALGQRQDAPQQTAPAQASEAQRKALEAQIDEALKNEPEEERARKKAALLAEFDRATGRVNAAARGVQAMEAEQAAQPAITAGDVADVVTRGTPGAAMRQAEIAAKDPQAREKAKRALDAAAGAQGSAPGTPAPLKSFVERLKASPPSANDNGAGGN